MENTDVLINQIKNETEYSTADIKFHVKKNIGYNFYFNIALKRWLKKSPPVKIKKIILRRVTRKSKFRENRKKENYPDGESV